MVSIFTDHPFNLVRIKKTVVFITSSHPFKIKQNHTRVETLEQRSIFFFTKMCPESCLLAWALDLQVLSLDAIFCIVLDLVCSEERDRSLLRWCCWSWTHWTVGTELWCLCECQDPHPWRSVCWDLEKSSDTLVQHKTVYQDIFQHWKAGKNA